MEAESTFEGERLSLIWLSLCLKKKREFIGFCFWGERV